MAASTSRLTRTVPLLFGSTIFTSACLLFLVQPLISKLILPWFGGSSAVWVTAMLFFQTCLLLGYLYAHFISSMLNLQWQVVIHTALLTLSFFMLPLTPNARWLAKPGDDPTFAVFLVLGTCVGLPYTLLASTSPLLQKWFSARSESSLPYRYFALSNFGSLIALFAFPWLVEPCFTGHQQSYLWSGCFALFTILCITTAFVQLRNQRPKFKVTKEATLKSSASLISFWTALSACASALVLMVTNLLTQNISPMPLLWVVPLGIYLLTFILCFERTLWYRRWIFLPLALPALTYIARTTHTVENDKLYLIFPLLLLSFFVACMACHGELSRLKPDPSRLTVFYLAISVGGALGGLTVALVAPRFFHANYEYPLIITVTAVVLVAALWRDRQRFPRLRLFLAVWLASAACIVLLSIYATRQLRYNQLQAKYMARNFYGTLRIDEFKDQHRRVIRQLNHGTITHGTQYLDSRWSHVPTTYYGRESGAGLTWRILSETGAIKMGVIGLGTGTLAAYGRAGDSIRFYDINPLVIDIAKHRFTYLSDSPAHIEISIGDARLALERESPQRFDILVVDAFSGDAVPVHLLTQEAFDVYWKHLKPDGVLVFHISNRFLDLEPVVAALAEKSGIQARFVSNEDDDQSYVFQSDYVLVTNRSNFFSNPLLKSEARPVDIPPYTRRWTDDFSNLWQVIHIDN